mgnify:CR=1 FL=1
MEELNENQRRKLENNKLVDCLRLGYVRVAVLDC